MNKHHGPQYDATGIMKLRIAAPAFPRRKHALPNSFWDNHPPNTKDIK